MKVIKVIFKVFIVLLFIVSVLLNILLMDSSYASLIFKYDETKFMSMNSTAMNYLDSQYLLASKDAGIQFKSNNIDSCDEFVANYYIDNESNVTFETVCSYKDENEKQVTDKVYFSDGVVYLDSNGVKSKKNLDIDSALDMYDGLYSHAPLFILDDGQITESESKTTIGFSFSPLYVVGINYKYTSSENDVTKYQYDFQGKLRKVTRQRENKTETYEISYKNQKIEQPNLEEYGA